PPLTAFQRRKPPKKVSHRLSPPPNASSRWKPASTASQHLSTPPATANRLSLRLTTLQHLQPPETGFHRLKPHLNAAGNSNRLAPPLHTSLCPLLLEIGLYRFSPPS